MHAIPNDKHLSVLDAMLLLTYDTDTGVFLWTESRGGKAKAGTKAGRIDTSGHVQISVNGRRHMAHRLAWLIAYGNWPDGFVDHIDGNPSNNAIDNLRCVSHKTNCENRTRSNKNNAAGVLGVHARKNTRKFRASITIDGVKNNLGSFETPEEAHAAYLSAKQSMRPFQPAPREKLQRSDAA